MSRKRGLVGLAVVSAVLLTGCGSVPDLNPGVAARVGDDTFSTSDVHDTATAYCDAQTPQEGQALPNRYINGIVAGSFALRAASDQLMAAHDVTVDDGYQQAIDSAQGQLAAMTDTEREAVIEVGAAAIYAQAAEVAVGRAVLGDSPSDKAALAAGEKELVAWIDDHDLQIDPRYGVTIEQGTVAATDTSISFPVSKSATAAQAAEPDAAYAATLPETQRCG